MGDDIAIDKNKKPPKPPTGKAVYPCTVAFLYTKLKSEMELLTDNCATEVTSWDYFAELTRGTPGTPSAEIAFAFRQRCDDFGDYVTGSDAITNNIKESRKPKPKPPGTGETGGGDTGAWPAGLKEAITVWYYIGTENDAARAKILANESEGKIFKVEGPSLHPLNVESTTGPGVCMEIWTNGAISSAIWPSINFGQEPLTAHLKATEFPELGGKIGYVGQICSWHGIQDYAASYVNFSRPSPHPSETILTPTSYPVPNNYVGNPWYATNYWFYTFGWSPYYLSAFSSAYININKSALNGLPCGGTIQDNSQWYWGGGSGLTAGNGYIKPGSGFDGVQGLFICWQGHRDHASMFRSFLTRLIEYWNISFAPSNPQPVNIYYLGAANPYGCGGGGPDGGGGGFPDPPPRPEPRILLDTYGRKAEVWLKVCRQEDKPLEIKLPFEYVALVEKIRCSDTSWTIYKKNGISYYEYATLETMGGPGTLGISAGCDTIHATVNIDDKGEFAYVDILYGAERVFQQPFTTVVPSILSNVGNGVGHIDSGFSGRRPGSKLEAGVFVYAEGEYAPPSTIESVARIRGDYFSYCQSYKIQLPTKASKTLTIAASAKYKRPEPITLSVGTPDNEFNNKYLICDFRTDRVDNIPHPEGGSRKAPWQNPQPYFASFGGLPCLFQIDINLLYRSKSWAVTQAEQYYKAQEDWTDLDYIYFELMENPEKIWGESSLPPNVFIENQSQGTIKFNLDGKFQRQGRSEMITEPDYFGFRYSIVKQYQDVRKFPLAIEFKEQMIGNGIIKEGVLTKWFRITSSSLPLFGQVTREP